MSSFRKSASNERLILPSCPAGGIFGYLPQSRLRRHKIMAMNYVRAISDDRNPGAEGMISKNK